MFIEDTAKPSQEKLASRQQDEDQQKTQKSTDKDDETAYTFRDWALI